MTCHDIPGLLFIDHFAIAVPPGGLEAQVEAYRLLGFTEVHREEMRGTDQVLEVLLRAGHGPNLVQLLEPLSPDSPVSRQIERNGGRPGFAHVAFRVSDIRKTFDYMKENGYQIIDPSPRPGSRNTTVFFVHPKTTATTAFGYLMEIVQENASGGH